MSVRTLVLWCPDWPVTAAEIVEGVPATGPVVVLHGNRVVACSEAARAEGVRRGLRRREAQSRCSRLVVVDYDPARDARAFEPVAAAVEEVAVGVEIIRPGACALAARGPSRYFGGEERAAERIVEQVAEACAVEAQAGIADGVFAAALAARAGRIVAPGQTRQFLSGTPVEALDRPELTDLLRRLGIRTLGDFAALPPSDVLSRFGFDGALAHRLAAGHDHRPLAVRRPPTDLDVSDSYDDPLDRVDVAAFAGRALAERLHERLAAHGLACTRLGIEAVTADGQELHRVWRHEGLLTVAAIAERVRWQLDGWLTGARRGGPNRPTAGLVRLRLIPGGVLTHLGLQPGLWGDTGADRDRAHRALSRVQGLLGPEAVVTAVAGGGRSSDDPIRLIPWGDERVPSRPATDRPDPYPGVTTVPALPVTPEPIPLRPPAAAMEAGSAPAESVTDVSRALTSVPASPAVPASPPVSVSTPVSVPIRGSASAPVSGSASAPVSGSASVSVSAPVPSASVSSPTFVSTSTTASTSAPVRRLASVPGPVAGSGSGRASGDGPRAGWSTGAAAMDGGSGAGWSPAAGSSAGSSPVAASERGPLLTLVPDPDSEPASDAAPVVARVMGTAASAADPGPLETVRPRELATVPSSSLGTPTTMPEVASKAGSAGPRRRPGRRVASLPPWPGRLPKPAPAVVLNRPLAAVVLDAAGDLVRVSARLEPTGLPDRLVVERGTPVPITGWAGPWPIDERWWAPDEARRRVRFQVGLADGRALLLTMSGGHWAVEAVYD